MYTKIGKNALLESLRPFFGRPLLVVVNGRRAFLVDGSGKVIPIESHLSENLENVEVYSLEKLEFLELLHPSNGAEKKKSTPSAVVFKYSASLSNLPAEIALRVEGAVPRIVKGAHFSGIAIERMALNGKLLHGVTGRDILRLRVSARGYPSVSAPEDVLKSIISDFLGEETGFETRVIMRDCSFEVVQKVPPVRLRTQVPGFRSGRVLGVPLHSSDVSAPRLNRAQVEKEVERILSEAGVEELLDELKDASSGKDISLGRVSSAIRDALSSMKGVSLKDVRLSEGGKAAGSSFPFPARAGYLWRPL
ncbi:hypothetical protein [Thermococcus sp. Bubb.Bath]|uniref:hypothetical protein n=1 Tax=Thermococcus sp. Bubb.Bath TaxID=1638242 RepID=UPI00143B9FE8|nr:hypothetical protein [Thermococcus sp. Bubb.Bath]NJF25461.1 hypothetical protein [Thermococcus sp. Bubb.Bath]